MSGEVDPMAEERLSGEFRGWEAGYEHGLKQAADLVHSEARWQWELDRRGVVGAQLIAQRMTMVENILRDALDSQRHTGNRRSEGVQTRDSNDRS